MKKMVLELGGSDPFIVMPSADLDAAVDTASGRASSTTGNRASRRSDSSSPMRLPTAFERKFVARMEALRVGDPLDAATELGPLARVSGRDGLHDQVKRSVAAGARLLTGGTPLDRPGYYYPPTVLAEVPAGAPAFREELFGPVATLFRVADAEAAIALANDSAFGLGCSVWTRDSAERERFVEEIDAGQVFVNSMVASDPRLPFGGIKRSGYGRELGEWGIREFVNVKTVSVTRDDASAAGGRDVQFRRKS